MDKLALKILGEENPCPSPGKQESSCCCCPGHTGPSLSSSEREGLKDAEIAGVFGLSLQTAKMRLHRARAKLRSELEAACELYRDERNELACDKKNPPIAGC